MPRYVIDLACGHHRHCTYKKPPPFLVPTETAWTLSWCPVCDHTEKVLDVRLTDGRIGDASDS